MKRIYATIIVLLVLAQTSNAQWTTSGTNIYNSNTGNVGIGTTTPGSKLEVVGGISSTSGNIFTYNSTPTFAMRDNAAGTDLKWMDIYNFAGTTSFRFLNDAYNAANNWLMVTRSGYVPTSVTFPNGNVGVGTTAPNRLFEVVGATINDVDSKSQLSVTSNSAYNTSPVGGLSFGLKYNSAGNVAFGASIQGYKENATNGDYSQALRFTTQLNGFSPATKMTILGNGNIGVGVVTPAALLHLNGPLDGNSSLTFGVANSPGNISVPVGASPGGYNIDFHTYRDVVPDQIGARIRAERINNFSANNALVQGTDLVFSTSVGYNITDLTERVRIKNSGGMAIGTAYVPSGYMLAVNGSAIATSVTVKLYANWPDYIFNSTYKLPLLSDVKTYIDKNHHLPDMPSAKDVEKDGLNLGEINTQLTKKVEELTLYLIEKDKQLNEQETRLKKIEDQLKTLTTK